MNKINKIMVVINGSEESYYAGMYAIYLNSFFQAELIGIYVINEKALNDLLKANIFFEDEKVDYEKEMDDDARRYLSQFKDMADKKNIVVRETLVKKGVVHQEILKTAEEKNVDLIIIGELRRIVSLRDIAYDEMEQVMREAKVPVVIV